MNVLLSSLYDRFSLGELKPTPITLQLADRSVKVPRRLIENVFVKVNKFYFSVDFIVLDVETTRTLIQILIVLGRPFLATVNACINCKIDTMDISFENKKVN